MCTSHFPSLPLSLSPSLFSPLVLTSQLERSEREEVEAQLGGVQEDCRLLEMEVEELAGKVERLTEECRERSDQANQWYKALQVTGCV